MADDPDNFVSEDVVAELTFARQAAMQCLVNEDFAGARKKANLCLLILATIPDGSLAGLSTQTWDRNSITLFLQQLDKMESSAETADSGGMLLQAYEYSGIRGGSC